MAMDFPYLVFVYGDGVDQESYLQLLFTFTCGHSATEVPHMTGKNG